ncbi:MAG TPA: hypothetical protein VLK89_07240 [Solirubrobacterales bacterium]|nr:hypothetical protein [Solirubrobacterales bacterium]
MGLGTIIGFAGAGGVISLVLATVLGLPDKQRDAWRRGGLAAGFALGIAIYLVALLGQIL